MYGHRDIRRKDETFTASNEFKNKIGFVNDCSNFWIFFNILRFIK